MKSAFKFKRLSLRSLARPFSGSCTLSLPDNSDDVLLTILSLCDILTVLSISRVSKHLRSLAWSRSVWFSLISDLYARNFIDYVPGNRLQALPVEELINLAKRTVQGPRSFSTRGETTGAYNINANVVLAERKYLSTPIEPNVQGSTSKLERIMLLPRGQFVLCSYSFGLQCWSVKNDRLLWRYQGHWSSFQVVEFDAEMAESGRAATIAIAVHVVEGSNTRMFVDIVHLDLLRGTSFSVFLYRPSQYKSARVSSKSRPSVKICGDFAILQVGRRYREYLSLLKISTQSFRSYSMKEYSYKALLLPGHIILADCVKRSDFPHWRLYFRIWNIDSLMTHPVQPGHESVQLKAPPILYQPVMFPPDEDYPTFFLSAHASPLQRAHYRIWVICPEKAHVHHPLALINKYDLTLDSVPSRKPLLQQRSSKTCEIPGKWLAEDLHITYSGHILRNQFSSGRRIWAIAEAPETGLKRTPNKMGKECLIVDLPLSGAQGPVKLFDYGGAISFQRGKQLGIHFYS